MRNVTATFVLVCFTLTCSAQTQVHPDRWPSVEVIQTGTDIYVYTAAKTQHCKFKGADETSLTCVHEVDILSFPRAGIRAIKHSHRGASLAIGVYAGLGLGTAVASNAVFKSRAVGTTLILTGVGIMIAVPILAYKFSPIRTTLYKAPPSHP